jgi:hypothetical protein
MYSLQLSRDGVFSLNPCSRFDPEAVGLREANICTGFYFTHDKL